MYLYRRYIQMTNQFRHTVIALSSFFLLLVILGTLNKDQDEVLRTISLTNDGETIIISEKFPEVIPDLPVINGTTVTWNEIPPLVELPKLAGIESPTDELPHLTLPPLQEF